MEVFNEPAVIQTGRIPKKLTIAGVAINGELWVTGVQGGMEPNYQLLPSLGAEVYINAFNDKLAQWVLSGYHVNTKCLGGGSSTPAYVQLYRDGNIVEGSEVTISYSDIVLKGFFVKLTVQANAEDPHNGDNFTLIIIGKVADA